MKKHFLIAAVFLLLFAPLAAPAQEVPLPAPVVAFLLEQNEKVKLLSKQIVDLKADIEILKSTTQVKAETARIFASDSLQYLGIIQVKNEEIAFKEKQLAQSSREIVKQKFLKVTAWVVTGVIIIGEAVLVIVLHNGKD